MTFARLSSSTACVVAAMLAVFAAAPVSAKAPLAKKTHAEIVASALDAFVLPHVETLARSADALEMAVASLCAAEGDQTATAARAVAASAFAETVRAWGSLEFIRFGPAAQKHRSERILFWPDPRGVAARQLSGLLAAKKPELFAEGGLAKQSVAVQGLAALEILLFDDKVPLGSGHDDDARYRCGLAAAIAANIKVVAHEIASGWTAETGFRHTMLITGSDNALYKDSSESARDVVKAIATGLEAARDRFILPELTGLSRTPPRRARLPFERAGLTGAYLEATLTGLHELFEASGLAAYIPPGNPWMAGFLANGWKSLLADAARLDAARRAGHGSEPHIAVLRKMRFDLGAVRLIIVKELAANAGIVLGFNELDGD